MTDNRLIVHVFIGAFWRDGSDPFEVHWDPEAGKVRVPGDPAGESDLQRLLDDPPEEIAVPHPGPSTGVDWGRSPSSDPHDFIAAMESVFGGTCRWTRPPEFTDIQLRRMSAPDAAVDEAIVN